MVCFDTMWYPEVDVMLQMWYDGVEMLKLNVMRLVKMGFNVKTEHNLLAGDVIYDDVMCNSK